MPDDQVKTALDRLADVLGAVGVFGRLPYLRGALSVMADESAESNHREFWRAIYDLCIALDDEETGQPTKATPVS